MAKITIFSLEHFIEVVRNFVAKEPEHQTVRYWFRGQSDVEWPLSPGVYRKSWPTNEDEKILKERHMITEFRHLAAHLIPSGTSDAECYFLQQHYGMPTRLLDWTNNPLSGLFFALGDAGKDGRVFMMDAYALIGSGGIATARRQAVVDCMSCLFDWQNNWPTSIQAVRPSSVETRIRAQSGFFTLHPKAFSEVTTAQNPTLTQIIIPSAKKSALIKDLDLLGFDEFSVYGDLGNLAKRLKRAFAV